MDQTPSVSIVIPAWNGEAYIENCLQALLAQDYPHFEVIVVDNASADQTSELVAARFPDVILIRKPENLGFAGGCNVGLRRAGGDILALLNQDTELYPGWIQAVVQALRQPAIGVVGCKIFYPDGETIQHAGGWLEWPHGMPYHHGYGEADSEEWNEARSVEFVTGAAMAFRRRVWEQVGPLDEAFWPGYFEDIDFCFRVRKAGYEIHYLPEARLSHHETTSIKEGQTLSRVFQRGRLRFLLKNVPPDYFLTECIPAEIHHQLPASQHYEDGVHHVTYRTVYLELISQAAAILHHCWQADSMTIEAVITKLQELHRLLWEKDWHTARDQVMEIVAQQPPSPPPKPEYSIPPLAELKFESSLPLIGPVIAHLRFAWYSIAARWAVQYLRDQQETINYRQEIFNRQQEIFNRQQEAYHRHKEATYQYYLQFLEQQVMDLIQEHNWLVQQISYLNRQVGSNLDDTE